MGCISASNRNRALLFRSHWRITEYPFGSGCVSLNGKNNCSISCHRKHLGISHPQLPCPLLLVCSNHTGKSFSPVFLKPVSLVLRITLKTQHQCSLSRGRESKHNKRNQTCEPAPLHVCRTHHGLDSARTHQQISTRVPLKGYQNFGY